MVNLHGVLVENLSLQDPDAVINKNDEEFVCKTFVLLFSLVPLNNLK